MKKIALFYAPEKGNTDRVAHKFAEIAGKDKFELFLVDENTEPKQLDDYDKIVFALSTVGRDSWSSEYTQIGWDLLVPKLEDYDFTGKTVAIIGLGDHILYANSFVDSMGVLAKVVLKQGARLVGKCSSDDYEFTDSEAIEGDIFLGLPIDEDNEDDLTEERLTNWWEEIKSHYE